MIRNKRLFFFGLSLLCLQGCSERLDLAPVEDAHWRQQDRQAAQYTVKRGDTLYAIAFRYDKDYHTLAAYNHLSYPYTLRIGQVIYLKPMVAPKHAMPKVTGRTASAPVILARSKTSGRWVRPAKGRVVAHFDPQRGKKGINIQGARGNKIVASSDGVVAYAGNGLSGYGNLIIIKHDKQFLTAYGHNARNFVREGQTVKKGQVIAEMGMINRRYYGVHFEVRKAGKPVNPLKYVA